MNDESKETAVETPETEATSKVPFFAGDAIERPVKVRTGIRAGKQVKEGQTKETQFKNH